MVWWLPRGWSISTSICAEPGRNCRETIATGSSSGGGGGFTTVCAMPNTVPVNDSVETTRWMQSAERNPSATSSFRSPRSLPGAGMGEALTEYGSLKAAGAVGVSDDGSPFSLKRSCTRRWRQRREPGCR